MRPFSSLLRPFGLIFTLAMSFASSPSPARSEPATRPAQPTSAGATASLVVGGGCFWCTEAAYERVPGVKAVVSGYAGGHVRNPTYEQVCGAATGHAEVIRIDYDPAQVTLEHLLELFWEVHDPTTKDRQGADEGPQYRSIILYADAAQKAAAEASKTAAQAHFKAPIVTEITALTTFYPAEGYHQDYFANNPTQGYCRVVIAPKLKKLDTRLKTPATP